VTALPAALPDAASARDREADLEAWLRRHTRVLIGYSGGVDSTYLAAVAVAALGPANVLGVIGRSASYPESQWRAARAAADAIGLPVRELPTDEMSDPRYAANPLDRCYYCKTELWSRLAPLAAHLGFGVIADGTNADDLHGHRPGMRAAREWNVVSPLADVGLTKADIRANSRARGVPTADQPSSPCLSSRLPTGTAVTPLRLARVEEAERAARALGIAGDLRVRYHGETARVELAYDELPRWRDASRRAALHAAIVGAGFSRVELDLRGFRSGKANDAPSAADLDVLGD
jgi:uncharacterized protein